MEKVYLLVKEVQAIFRYQSRSAFIKFRKNAKDFPEPVDLGTNRKVYVAKDIYDWIDNN